MSSMAERLKAAIGKAGTNGTALGRTIGRSHTAVSDILRGKSDGGQIYGDLARALDVDPLWLHDGTGTAPDWWRDESNQDCDCREMREIIALKDDELRAARLVNAQLMEELLREREARAEAERVLAHRAADCPSRRYATGKGA